MNWNLTQDPEILRNRPFERVVSKIINRNESDIYEKRKKATWALKIAEDNSGDREEENLKNFEQIERKLC